MYLHAENKRRKKMLEEYFNNKIESFIKTNGGVHIIVCDGCSMTGTLRGVKTKKKATELFLKGGWRKFKTTSTIWCPDCYKKPISS